MHDAYWWITTGILIPAIVLASWIDYRQRRVPNWLNGALALAGFIVQGSLFGVEGLQAAFLGLSVGFGVLIVPWLMGGMGAGDVKLMMAIGAWIGPWLTLLSFCVGGLVGGAIALVMIAAAGKTWAAYANLMTIAHKVSSRERVFSEFGSAKSFGNTSALLPYGVPLTIGTLTVWFGQSWVALPW
jgi:prepilin peptidase CpaA